MGCLIVFNSKDSYRDDVCQLSVPMSKWQNKVTKTVARTGLPTHTKSFPAKVGELTTFAPLLVIELRLDSPQFLRHFRLLVLLAGFLCEKLWNFPKKTHV